jgi:hypothetical protein
MSIKTFHQVIILAAFVICLTFTYWCYTDPFASGLGYEIGGGVSFLLAIGLVVYEIYFLKKTKKIFIH